MLTTEKNDCSVYLCFNFSFAKIKTLVTNCLLEGQWCLKK
jgi:hypothetical protein